MTLQLIIETLRRERAERFRNQRQNDKTSQRDNPVKPVTHDAAGSKSRLPGHPSRSPTMTASTKTRLAGQSIAPHLQNETRWLAHG